ncbi:hypothetical protein [Croceicoccus hydrothermalis]|uniref:hypothetical protein n=1 Tax=Croceicoccus hydrothermalis TaxID=2867964 RepID=UPI001EFBD912|nr:hypothetical protein [Croceicoccus hydrothermalis]
MLKNSAAAVVLVTLLAACAVPASQAPVGRRAGAPSSTPLPQRPDVPTSTAFRAPRVMNLPGLEGVIGADAGRLVQQFGTPRLDVWEDDARKLQFAGSACTLDIYLYPAAPRAQERATYVDARRSDGREVDRAACVRALRR